MKPVIIILAILILLGAVGAYYLYGVARGAKTIIMNRLTQASTDLKKHGTFTNDIPQFCEIHTFSEHYTVGGVEYQCALAANSPMFRGRGFMAITTNEVLLWIDRERGATPMSGPEAARQQ